MSGQFATETIGYGIVLPAVVSAVVWFALCRLLAENAAARYAAAIALVAGFVAGYAFFDSSAAFVPSRHWHWLPWVAALAVPIGALGMADGVSRVERWLLEILLAIAAAWLIVPHWSNLEPSRTILFPGVAAYLFLISALLTPPVVRESPRTFLAAAVVAAAVTAAGIAAFVSLTYGRLAGLVAAALFGLAAAALFRKGATNLGGMVPAYAVLSGGCTFVGAIEPAPPLFGFLVMAAAPVGLSATTYGPLKHAGGWKGAAIRGAVLLAILGAGFLWVVFASRIE